MRDALRPGGIGFLLRRSQLRHRRFVYADTTENHAEREPPYSVLVEPDRLRRKAEARNAVLG